MPIIPSVNSSWMPQLELCPSGLSSAQRTASLALLWNEMLEGPRVRTSTLFVLSTSVCCCIAKFHTLCWPSQRLEQQNLTHQIVERPQRQRNVWRKTRMRFVGVYALNQVDGRRQYDLPTQSWWLNSRITVDPIDYLSIEKIFFLYKNKSLLPASSRKPAASLGTKSMRPH